MNISVYVTLFILLYTAAIAAITLTQAHNKSWITAAVRLAATLVSAFLAIPLAKALSGPIGDLVTPLFDKLLPEKFQDLLAAVPALEEGIEVFCSMLVAVLLYLPAFLVFRVTFGITIMVLERELPIFSREGDKKIAISLSVAGVHALLMAIVTLIPLCGFIMMGSHLIGTVEETPALQAMLTSSEDSSLPIEAIESNANDLERNPCVITVHYTLGKPIFYLLTTDTLDKTATHGETVNLNMERELCGLIRTAGEAVDAANTFGAETFSEADKTQLFEAADALFESKWVSYVTTDALVALSTSWKNGESFMGVTRPTMAEVIDPTFVCLLDVLSIETSQTLSEDIHIILDVLGDLRLKGFLDSDTIFYEDLIRSLGQDGFLTTLRAKLDQNERMHLLVDELKTMNVRLVGSMLGVENLQSGQYDALLDDVAGSLNDVLEMPAEERNEIIKQTINQNFDAHGYHVPEDVALEVSDKIITELGADGEITKEELTEFLSNYASKSDVEIDSGDSNQNGNSSTDNNGGNGSAEDVTLPESLPDEWVESLPDELPDELPNGWADSLPESIPEDIIDDILGGLTGETQAP